MPGCGVGDLCIITQAYCKENIGKICTVLGPAPPGEDGQLNWTVNVRAGEKVFLVYLNKEITLAADGECQCYDAWLTPIRPSEEEDVVDEVILELELARNLP